MKKDQRIPQHLKKKILDKVQAEVRSRFPVEAPNELKEKYASDSPSFAPPESEGLGDFALYAETACDAIGVPYECEPDKIYHFVGHFTGNSSTEALNAFVHVYNTTRIPRNYIFNYDEYLDAIKRIGKIQAQLGAADRHRQSERERYHKYQEQYSNWMATDSNKPPPSYFEREAPDIPPPHDLDFLFSYTVARYKPNFEGYKAYIESVASDLNKFIEIPIPFHLEEDPDKPHGYVLGSSGSGKSELLKLLIHTYIKHEQYGSVVVIDPAGDFVSQIAHWKEFNTNDRLVYIKPTLAKGFSPVINPFEIYGVQASDYSEEALSVKRVVMQRLSEAIAQIVADITPAMETVLKNCILVLLDKEGATLEDLHRFMIDDKNSHLIDFAKSLHHHERLTEYFSLSSSGFKLPANKVTKGAVERRLGDLLMTGYFKRLTCGKSTLCFEELLEQKHVLVFDLAQGAIGQEESTAFGRLIIAMLLGIAYRRSELPEHQRVPVSLVIDECQYFVTKSMINIVNDTRKFKLTMTLAQQTAGQNMPIDLRETITGGTQLLMVGKSRRNEAKRNADMIGGSPDEIARLNKGEFFTMPKGYPPAVKFKTRADLLRFNNSVENPLWNLTRLNQIEQYYSGVVNTTGIEFDDEPDISPQTWD